MEVYYLWIPTGTILHLQKNIPCLFTLLVKLQKLSINPSIFVLRDPVDQFESMYNYVHFESKLSLGLEEFVEKYVRPGLPVRRVQGFRFF